MVTMSLFREIVNSSRVMSLPALLVCMKNLLFDRMATNLLQIWLQICYLIGWLHLCLTDTDNSRDARDKVHFCLVADAGQFGVHCLTFRTSGCLIGCGHRCVEAVVVVVVTG